MTPPMPLRYFVTSFVRTTHSQGRADSRCTKGMHMPYETNERTHYVGPNPPLLRPEETKERRNYR